jgi:hypothetical protein
MIQPTEKISNVLPRSQASIWRYDVQAAGTYSPPDKLVDEALASAGGSFALFSACTNVRDSDATKPLSRELVKYYNAILGTVQTNPTNFETGDGNIAGLPVAMNHYSLSFNVSDSDAQGGLKIGDLLVKNMSAFAASLASQVTALCTPTNFPNAPLTGAATSFDTATAGVAFGSIANAPQKFLILDSPWFGNLNASAGAKGFQSGDAALGFAGIYDNSVGWASAGPNVHGLALGKSAIVIVNGQLAYGRTGGVISRRFITLPCGLSCEINFWFQTATRSYWCSLDCVLGCAVADSTVGTLIQSA